METRILNRIRLLCIAIVLTIFGSAAHAAELMVSAAASLTNAFKELGPVFEARHPGTKVLFNFGASDSLVQQIAKGAPVDVFASADQEAMDKAAAQKLVDAGSRKNFVGNKLVVIVPMDNAIPIKTLDDLQQPAVKRIALGNPANVPAGRYTKHALELARLWSNINAKAVNAQSVRQSLDYVARGEVEAGFVYATDAALMKDKVRVAMTVPTATPITYPIAAVAGSGNTGIARQFIDLTLSPDGQAILSRHGFTRP